MLAFLAARELARRAIGARLEVKVAEAAFAARSDAARARRRRQVGDQLARLGILDHGADGHAQHDIFRATTVLVGAAAVLAALRAMDARIAIVDQRVDVAIGDGVDAAAASAVAAVGPAARDVLLAAERCDAVAAVAGDDLDRRFVEEFHVPSRR